VQDVRLIRGRGETRVAEAFEKEIPRVDAVAGQRSVREQLGAKTEGRAPPGERGRRGDELLVGGRQKLRLAVALVERRGGRQVDDADGRRGAREAASTATKAMSTRRRMGLRRFSMGPLRRAGP
jgi:hypothetical protein